MQNRIDRPTNPYSTDWHLYNAQNPHLHRSVGADGADGDNEPTVESLQAELAKIQEESKKSVDALAAQNELLLADKAEWKAKQDEYKSKRIEQEKAAKLALEEAARKSGDVEALENSWNEKFTTETTSLKEQIAQRDKWLNGATVGNAALLMATEIANKPEYVPILQRYIADDLTMDTSNDKPDVKVMQNGQPSALTLDELKAKVIENPMFAEMIRASNANGSGGAGDGGGGGSNTIKRDEFDKLNPLQRQKHISGGGKVSD